MVAENDEIEVDHYQYREEEDKEEIWILLYRSIHFGNRRFPKPCMPTTGLSLDRHLT